MVVTYTSVVTIACVVVGTGAGVEPLGTGIDEVGLSGELFDELSTGTGVVVTGLSGMVEVDGVDTGGTHCVHTVDVLVIKTVEIIDVVSIEVLLPLVTVFVTGQVVNVVITLERSISMYTINLQDSTYTSVVTIGTVVPGVVAGEVGELPVLEVTGLVSTAVLETGVEYTELLED